jgi:CheY-like chemotaxis protein
MTRVLVIDDEDLLRETLREMLEEAGYEVSEEADGLAGVRAFFASPIDLVITDIIMPKKDGIEAIREIKRHRPDARIIAISGGAPRGPRADLPLAETSGARCTLQKPFTRDELLRAIADVLARAAAGER